ncbi:MAG: GH36-type glycosyl hydrolase domain-containing protein, partial [Gemmatimonadota bacterium]
ALEGGRLGLSGSTGATLDPIYSLGCEVELAPYESVDLVFVTAAGASRSEVLRLLERYRSVQRCETAVDWARDRIALLLDRYDIAPRRVRTIQRLFSGLVHRGPAAGPARSIETAGPSRSGLWKHGISGDDPILLVRVDAPEDTSLIYQLLRAHAYLLRQGARFDLVILDRASSGYAQPLRDRLHSLLERAGSATLLGRPGGVHIVDLSRAEEAELQLLESSARVVVEGGEADLSLEPAPEGGPPAELPEFIPVPSAPIEPLETPPLPAREELVAFNGLGGFSPDGSEYVIRIGSGVRTPAPWANVVANPSFGFIVTEAGGGYTWALNAGENRLTPWRNDPVADLPGEVIYLRDEEIGSVWSVTPAPAGPTDGPEAAACEVRHGAGYTSFRHRSHGLDQKLTLFCAPEDPVKIFRLRLADLWDRQRRVTATCFVEWVLGTDPETAAPHVATGYDADEELILARNPFNDVFGSRCAFVGSSLPPHGVTTDRTEFLGRRGSHACPAALHRIGLSGWIGAAEDPCAAYQVHLDIPPGATTEVYFVLGQGESHEEAVRLARRYSEPDGADAAFGDMTAAWDELLGALTVETPEPALDVMLNRWLLYQTVSSRLWGRTGLYQSSGAFGFRDQLQDVVALLDAAPDLARAHLVRAAGRQFEEGDVLHWWQPGTATGVRTRCSDDLLWLPYATALYVKRTGDLEVLDEAVPFLRGEPLQAGEDERYGRYEAAIRTGDLYEHCLRAIDRGTTRGEHGLPLIGSGDWNDGFDGVGREGRGESVWLAWFLAGVLEEFAFLCEVREDDDRARSFRERAAELRSRVDATAWDGRWYHRAYYDDGTPLGSAGNREGRIDAISQAWSVLAGADEERSRTAMDAVAEHLVLDDERLVLLLTPPFDRTDRDPGYIKGYPPGVRENGGQYTHAAAWVGWAFAALGDSEAAGRVLGYMNPVLRTTDRESVMRYRVEPYVVAADIYGVQPHVGRGGWTWYTGSAAWLYRFAVEAVLGLRREGDRLHVTPALPPGWEGYRAELSHGSARYRIDVARTVVEAGEPADVRIRIDGRDIGGGPVALVDDGETHEVDVRVGPSPTAGLSEPRAG